MLPLKETFRHNGQKVAWGRIGTGEPTVFIHGFPWSSQAWRRIAPCLASTRSMYYFDMVGCGESEKFEGQDVSPGVQNDLLANLLNHWGIEKPHVVGHDFGGLAALRGYFINKLQYASLTLINAVAVLPSGSPFYSHVRDNEAAFHGLPAYAHEALFHAYTRNAAVRPFFDDVREMFFAPWRGDAGQPAFYRQIAQSGLKYIEELQNVYCPMNCPVQMLWGEEDAFLPIHLCEKIGSLVGAKRMTYIPNAGHLVQEDAPEQVVAALLSSKP